MSKDKIVNGYYQTNITTSRGENITYTTEYAIDKLQQENKQLKGVIEEVREKLKLERKVALSLKHPYTVSNIDEVLQILDKVKGE